MRNPPRSLQVRGATTIPLVASVSWVRFWSSQILKGGRSAREDLFEPLGMKDSSFGLDASNPRRVKVSQTEKMQGPTFTQMVALLEAISLGDAEQPSGGAHVSADDVFRFADTMLQRGTNGDYRVISLALFDYAARNHTGDMLNAATEFAVEAEVLICTES